MYSILPQWRHRHRARAAAAAVCLIAAAPLSAETYHIDPAAAGGGDGSQGAPWSSVEDALAARILQGGDTVDLAAGDYGSLTLNGHRFDSTVTFSGAEDPAAPSHFTDIRLINSANITFEHLSVWPTGPSDARVLIITEPNTDSVAFRDIDLRSLPDPSAYPTWSIPQWDAARVNGVALRGADNRLEDSHLTAVSFGITATGPRAVIRGNWVQGFSGDGIRALGDHSLIEGNRVQDCARIDGNHPDGFQSWSLGPNRNSGGGIVTGLVIRSNIILEWVSTPRPDFTCQLQGIGMFDGMYADTIVENNIIGVTAYHGITLAGATNTRIVNNTVFNPLSPGGGRPWIRISPHKNDTPSEGGVIANNITPALQLPDMDLSRMTIEQNLVGPYPGRYLQAPYAGDFTPLPGSAALDGGYGGAAPAHDIFGTARPQGAGPDIGAVEAR